MVGWISNPILLVEEKLEDTKGLSKVVNRGGQKKKGQTIIYTTLHRKPKTS